MTKTAKERIEEEIKDVNRSLVYSLNKNGRAFNSGKRQGLTIALAHIQNASTLVTSEETVTINKNVYDLLIDKVNKQREALKDIVFFSQGCYDSDYFANIAKKALAEIGGER
ncbi:hypothetical protein NGA84_10010 [Lactococcus formosensis]|uniref:Uncharacterized protein n=1 Tax=Lactococcus formosensis TaxID=1281486 RepID=A0A9X4SPA0_9LACT|nr:hypothetical protein [Lactococcus formosensis]MDG6143661.1 hypothetical protein [Lactococcus formosensis]MDG6160817.1 hypothetical protein [Lactococcus formosensis]MDG6194372.1 hypothetical protein [Lactococcus formosensis]